MIRVLGKDQLRNLFGELRLYHATLMNQYGGSVEAYAHDLVCAWIQGRDGVLKSEDYPGGPTWENLKKALEELGHKGTANIITPFL